MADETGWLIERWYGDTLHYWNAGSCGGRGKWAEESFTNKIDDAVRFARKEDADVILHRLLGSHGRSVEHKFGATFPAKTHSEGGQ